VLGPALTGPYLDSVGLSHAPSMSTEPSTAAIDAFMIASF
jgi:hypothetical protein